MYIYRRERGKKESEREERDWHTHNKYQYGRMLPPALSVFHRKSANFHHNHHHHHHHHKDSDTGFPMVFSRFTSLKFLAVSNWVSSVSFWFHLCFFVLVCGHKCHRHDTALLHWIIRECMLLICFITNNIYLDPLIQVMSYRRRLYSTQFLFFFNFYFFVSLF